MQTDQLVNFIRTVPLFHSFSPEQLEHLARGAEERKFVEGELVVEKDQEGTELFIIVEGEYQAFLRQEEIDYDKEVDRLWPGDHFGAIPVITGHRYAVSIRALSSGWAIVLGAKTIDDLFESSPAFGRALCRSLAGYVSQTLEKVATIPFARLDSYPRLDKTVRLLPARISRFCQSLAVEQNENRVLVAMVNPSDTKARAFVTDVLRQHHVEFVAVAEEDFERHAARVLGSEVSATPLDSPFDTLSYVTSSGESVSIAEVGAEQLLPRVLTQAIRAGASDIHFEPDDVGGRVRLRIDGKMAPVEEGIPATSLKQVATRIKIMSELDITNIRRPQDGRFMVWADERRVEFRVSVTPCQGGEKVVLRVIAPNAELENLSNLILSEPVARFADDLFQTPSGLVLVTGPTGSGKTTTLYAALNSIEAADRSRNIVTIEDPVEYNLPYATQVQVNRDAGLDFAQILRSTLRQDPDVILVGEIRDRESAAIALEASSTGHLVLSSLHTHSTMEALVRLRDLDVPPYLMASELKGVISQKLVPRLCPGCTTEVSDDDAAIERLRRLGVLEGQCSGSVLRGMEGEGCPPNGEQGRVGVYEMLSVSEALRDGIDRDLPMSELKSRLTDESFFSMARYAGFLLKAGIVSPERIERIFPKIPSAMG